MIDILLAAGDDSMRAYLTRVLERSGHRVTAVVSGADALARIERVAFDLLLTDIVMPELDGITLAQRGAGLRPTMRIIFMTGFSGVTLEVGAAQTLSAPFHLRDLVRRVDRLFELGSAAGI